MDKQVFILLHSYRRPEDDEDDEPEAKLIGVYSSEQAAKAAIVVLAQQPGFCDYPDAFVIDEYRLDVTSWTEGFVTIPGDDP